MKLYEFFGKLDVNLKQEKTEDDHYKMTLEEKDQFKNELYFYILDHDDSHRKQFHDVAETITKDKESKKDIWMPMINKCCMEFYREKKMPQDPKDLFDSKFRNELCDMVDEHYRKDIIKGEYRLGKK
jgi:hypothetical protein